MDLQKISDDRLAGGLQAGAAFVEAANALPRGVVDTNLAVIFREFTFAEVVAEVARRLRFK